MNAPTAMTMLLTATLTAMLAGCGGDEATAPTPSTPTGQRMAPGSGSAAPMAPTGTPTGTIDPSMAAYRTACNFLANKVTAALHDPVARGDDREYPIVLTEESATPCSLTKVAVVTLLDAAGRTVATAKPGIERTPVVVTSSAPAQFTLTTPAGGTVATAKIRIKLPNDGGTTEIGSRGLKVTPSDVTVDGFAKRA
ncbi:DUF4232 domain-containing protein [Spirillospora sp. NPDC047279]|uniref:DUF4232 domain-containing protein n=1 Tax=Spirillospora sp. NPDC047279 TaxID=3155478 RepID=UPI003406FA9E